MGVNHSMNDAQVDAVLSKFEATTDAIRGIESKVKRVNEHVIRAQAQRAVLEKQSEAATKLMDGLTESLNSKSEVAVEYFLRTLDTFADLIEAFELSISDLGIMNAPKEVQRELGPLLMPAVVLVFIVTLSNCVFGFLLASDAELASTFSFGSNKDVEDVEGAESQPTNILNLFAIFHVVLIGIAAAYLLYEGLKRSCSSRNHSRPPCVEEESEHDSGDGEFALADVDKIYSSATSCSATASPRHGNPVSSSKPLSSMLRTLREKAIVSRSQASGVTSWVKIGMFNASSQKSADRPGMPISYGRAIFRGSDQSPNDQSDSPSRHNSRDDGQSDAPSRRRSHDRIPTPWLPAARSDTGGGVGVDDHEFPSRRRNWIE